MKTILIPFICLFLLTGNLVFAQARFVADGTIEFEKSVNMHAVIKRQIGKNNLPFEVQMFDIYKKNQPQFKTFRSTLSFSKDKTLYEPIPGDNRPVNFVTGNPVVEQNNTIYTDLSANSIINQKIVYEQTFLIKDSARKITWKITDETRDIAGYTCRRANGIMMDSIYVVAFYTDLISVSGGPESFSGLPGMILGVALPHDNITWFATKVNAMSVPSLKIPSKGKVVNNKELRATLETALKNRGPMTPILLKGFLL